tara:strand:- start:454 stop:1044 length:591 start_codon:yes stop_codon:yes gene_type:complete
MIYFTSDWHVGEQQLPNTHSYLRPHPTEVMVEEWLQQCQDLLTSEDTIVFLGDIGITLDDLRTLQRLPECHKILILGDKEYANKAFTLDEFIERNQEQSIFHEVHMQSVVRVDNKIYTLAHKPTDCIDISNFNGRPALCGHVHGIWRTQYMPNGQPIINVGIDAWGGVVSEDFIAHQYDCVMKKYYDKNCFPADWE